MTTSSSTVCTKLTAKQAYDIGMESYWYFYPLLTMDITRKQITNLPPGQKPGYGPMNAFSHIRAYPDAAFKVVVRPNFDTLYSCGWLDLSKEPMIVSAGDSKGRYYLLPMLDMWSDVFASPGWRTSGTQEQHYLVVPPNWSGSVPEGVQRIDATTPYVWVIGRTKTDGPDDYPAVHAFQDSLQITPLSQWKKAASTPAQEIDKSLDMTTPPLEAVNALGMAEYLAKAAELLKIIPPHKTDWSILARLGRLGFEPGKSFDLKQIEPELQQEVSRGAADALKIMLEKVKSMGRPVNGWGMNTDTMGVYGNYYFKRAIVTMVGLGANQPEDAVYPLNFADANGEALTGDKAYVISFTKDNMPPVDAFWSITMYDADGFQVANELNRFAISSWMKLNTNSDGSMDIYIQHNNPGKEKESNWLPAPSKGVLGVTMRLYAPQTSVLNGDWVPPAIKKLS